MSLNSMIFKVFLLVAAVPAAAAGPDLLDLEYRPLASRDPVNLAQRHAGQVLLVVNTASKCGFTPQYAGLEELYAAHKDEGFVVLGFPCNQFGGQEPGSSAQIAAFCSTKFHVSFPMFEKVDVKGEKQSPVYAFLTKRLGVPAWNFHKYLVGKDGKVIAAFPSDVAPESRELRAALEAALR